MMNSPYFCFSLSLIQVLAEYDYSQLDTVAVDIVEDAITLNMKRTEMQQRQLSFNFETKPGQKEDIANLIASYSPSHQNWQRVGEVKTNVVCNIMQLTW